MKEKEARSLCYALSSFTESVPMAERKNVSAADSSGSKRSDAVRPGGETVLFFDDYALVQEALNNFSTAEIVMRRLYPRIHGIVRSIVGAAQNLDDIAQLAALEVARCLDAYQGRGSLEAWASKIAFRKATRIVRREGRKKALKMPFFDNEVVDENVVDPEKCLSREQLFNSFLCKLNSIPSKRRTPLLLHMLYGYTVKEVSELTETTSNTVKDRLKTASRELHAILERNPHLVTAMLEEMP